MNVLCARMSNGVLMPAVGFGTWKLRDTNETSDVVQTALESGYFHLDCAIVYNNQEYVCKGFNRFDVSRRKAPTQVPPCAHFKNVALEEFRENFHLPHGTDSHARSAKDVFLTSKIFTDTFTPEGVRWSADESLRQLGRPIDLMLLHWPVPNTKKLTDEELQNPDLAPVRLECWRTLEALYHEGKFRAIGVSNFMEKHLVHLISDVKSRQAAGDATAVVPMVNQ
eukprot:Gregarina_sp_Poly_1__8132@NODE_46_length_17826_cov_295_961822_g40_i0_p6_GENE_NODE_46_length_17826_cov_295_961822_g40_i0NODE_46_length_17826_cov_295_961822_g40_i0_p6_ORF_typecomplete_len224_score24_24Aldo_ket_red/PF00248_21/2_1e06Aldo_ket_red/PF00248_21/1_7e19_NODE_46_length_17826_cov_295_961822_g40_i084599130